MHDWPQDAIGQAIPYGIYELTGNRGFVCIGDCFNTPRFAVEAIRDWWAQDGSRRFVQAERLLILADAGGSNSCRSRVWKAQLQDQLALRCLGAHRHGVPLSQRLLEVEPHRAPPLQRHQHQLGGRALAQFRDRCPLHRGHRHRHRPPC